MVKVDVSELSTLRDRDMIVYPRRCASLASSYSAGNFLRDFRRKLKQKKFDLQQRRLKRRTMVGLEGGLSEVIMLHFCHFGERQNSMKSFPKLVQIEDT